MMGREKNRNTVECRHCQAKMVVSDVKRYTGKWPLAVGGVGVATCLVGGVLIGIPLLLGGIYMSTARQTICHCPECGFHYKVWLPEEESL
jgi:hypothetical protein